MGNENISYEIYYVLDSFKKLLNTSQLLQTYFGKTIVNFLLHFLVLKRFYMCTNNFWHQLCQQHSKLHCFLET